MQTASRRILFLSNAILTTSLLTAVVIMAVHFAGRFGGQIDLTATGVNSLSAASRELVRSVNEPIRITAFYTVISDVQKFAQKHKDMVKDLLALYESQNRGKISTYVVDPVRERTRIDEVLERLRNKAAYKTESEAHRAAIEKYPKISDALIATLNPLVDSMRNTSAQSQTLQRNREFQIVGRNLSTAVDELQNAAKDIAELKTGDVPRYGRAIEVMRQSATLTKPLIDDSTAWLAREASKLTDAPDELRKQMSDAAAVLTQASQQLGDLLKETENLKKVKLEDVYEQLARSVEAPTILVEAGDEVRVASYEDVWPFRSDQQAPAADGDDREFAGEEAVSGAILQLTRKDKTGVMFTRFGGDPALKPDFSKFNPMMGQLPRAPYQQLNERLDKENFIVAEWDVSTEKAPPPLEGAKKTVYVVLPPPPAPQPNPMNPQPPPKMTEADKTLILNAVGEASGAIFLTGWEPPGAMFQPAGPYEFGDYLKSNWGVDVESRFLVLHFAPSPQNPELYIPKNRQPLSLSTDIIRLTEHPIVSRLKSTAASLVGVAPLKLLTGNELPSGVTLTALGEIGQTSDVWAIDDVMRVQQDLSKKMGTKPQPTDRMPPFSVAVAGERKTGDRAQRVVVFGSKEFASDDFSKAKGVIPSGGGLVMYYVNPGNEELFVNALHWLSGDENRISVGPRRADIPRLDKLVEGPVANFWRAFLVAIWPAAALLAGGAAWLMRRR
ncbi:MAG: Gldg family protein [Phycisphaerales bacterium]|nr:Gldg family protein [Phycisphaerales bacterium]